MTPLTTMDFAYASVGPAGVVAKAASLNSDTNGVTQTQTDATLGPRSAKNADLLGNRYDQDNLQRSLRSAAASARRVAQITARMNHMAKALERLQDTSPLAGKGVAGYSVAIKGGHWVQAQTGAGDDTLAISGAYMAHSIDSGAGNDAVAITARRVFGVDSGAGNDAVAIRSRHASSIDSGDGHDAVAIESFTADNIYTGAGNDSVAIKADWAVSNVQTGAGDDSVSVRSQWVSRIHTGTGNDAVTIKARQGISFVHNDANGKSHFGPGDARVVGVKTGDGNDVVAINADILRNVDTGTGNDTIAINATDVRQINTGAGNDVLTLKGGIVSNIRTGDGDDVVNIDAMIGTNKGVLYQKGEYRTYGNLVDTVKGRMANAVSPADVMTGAGDDIITVGADKGLSLRAGTGDDTLNIKGGTIALHFGAQDGHDTVSLAPGAEVVIRLDDDVTEWNVETDGDAMILHIGDSSIRFEDITNAGAIGITRSWNNKIEILHSAPVIDMTV